MKNKDAIDRIDFKVKEPPKEPHQTKQWQLLLYMLLGISLLTSLITVILQASQISSLNSEISGIVPTLESLRKDSSVVRPTLDALRRDNATLQPSVSTLQRENNALKATMESLQRENATLRSSVESLQGENNTLRSTIDVLRNTPKPSIPTVPVTPTPRP